MQSALSIVVPTKNRALYCFSTIKSILAYENSLQLIVQDSSDNEELRQKVETLSDPRLIYKKVSPNLNMTENFDSALQLATGKYVLMIGDDDGISPKVFEAVDICERTGADSVTSSQFYASYNWPDFRSKYSGDSQAGKLSLNAENSSSVSEVNLAQQIDNFLSEAGQGCLGLPRIYHGLVSQRLIQEIRNRYGKCFFGVSPDVSFSFLAGLNCRKHLTASFPISIAGASGNSNAGRSALRTHKGELWEDPHMKHYRNEPWPSTIPEFFSVESVWSQASLAAMNLCEPKYKKRFNFALLYALMSIRHPDQSERIKKSIDSYLTASGMNSLHFAAKLKVSQMLIIARTGRDAFKAVRGRFVKSKKLVMPAPDIETASAFVRAQFGKIQ